MQSSKKYSIPFAWIGRLIVFFLLINTFGCGVPDTEKKEITIVVQNYYWAKPGMVEQVYQQRLLASSIREKFGHPVGRVLKLINQSDSLPDVMWECEYPNLEARKQDADKIMENKEFTEVANKMGTLIKKFDRAIYEVY